MATNLYKCTDDDTLLPPEKQNIEGKTDIHPEGTADKNKEQTTTKQLATQKNHSNDIHATLGHSREERMNTTTKTLQYIINGTLEVCQDCAKVKSKQK